MRWITLNNCFIIVNTDSVFMICKSRARPSLFYQTFYFNILSWFASTRFVKKDCCSISPVMGEICIFKFHDDAFLVVKAHKIADLESVPIRRPRKFCFFFFKFTKCFSSLFFQLLIHCYIVIIKVNRFPLIWTTPRVTHIINPDYLRLQSIRTAVLFCVKC